MNFLILILVYFSKIIIAENKLIETKHIAGKFINYIVRYMLGIYMYIKMQSIAGKKTWDSALRSCEVLGESWYLPYGENKEIQEIVTQAMEEAGVSSLWTGIKLTKYSVFFWENGEVLNEQGIIFILTDSYRWEEIICISFSITVLNTGIKILARVS